MMDLKRLLLASCLLGFSITAYAVPTLQVHGVDSVVGNLSGDEDTWLTSANQGSLELIGTYRSNTVSITNAFLVLTTTATDSNPFGSDYIQYDDAAAFEATLTGFPTDGDINLNRHNPYGLDGSLIDTFAFDLSSIGMGSFGNSETTKDCNADTTEVAVGTTTCSATNSLGQIHTFNYDFSGLSLDWVHFDLVAFVTDETGGRWVTTTISEAINPGSHDTTWTNVPETTSLLLLMVGLFGLVAVKRKA